MQHEVAEEKELGAMKTEEATAVTRVIFVVVPAIGVLVGIGTWNFCLGASACAFTALITMLFSVCK